MDTNSNGPQSPFNPFQPSPRSAEFNAARQNGDSDDDFFFEAHSNLAPMPNIPPPPPPPHPAAFEQEGCFEVEEQRNIPKSAEKITDAASTRITTGAAHPISSSGKMPPLAPSSKRTKTKKAKKKKDKKKEGKGKSKGKAKSKEGKSGSYSQYSSIQDNNGNGNGDGHNIVHYEAEEGENAASLFAFCKPQRDGTENGAKAGTGAGAAWNNHRMGETIASMPLSSKLGKISLNRRTGGINTGVANSAAGEGTTVPQLLATMRFFTILLSALTIAFEAWAMLFNVIFLKGDKVVLGVYLLFFIGLLLVYEFVRGNPVPTSNVVNNNHIAIPFMGNGSINMNAAQVVELVWTVVLEKRWARQLRYFLQSNFGILYTCVGKGAFLCFVGSVAIGQKFLLIEILGAGFVLFGLWTISLRFRYPALEKAMIMDLENEFGECDDISLAGESAVTWSSFHSSIRSNSGEKRNLLSRNGVS